MTAPDDDGHVRCDWAIGRPGPDFLLYRDYHDQEWGQPLHGRVPLFERMSLEAFQSGLSWLIILRKRENFRKAFDGFDIEKVARFTDADVDRLLADQGIVRNRAKIVATIANARAAADVDLSELLWSFAPAARSPASLRGGSHRRRCGPLSGPQRRRAIDPDRHLKRRRGGHVHPPARIGNNGVVNVQFNVGNSWPTHTYVVTASGARPALIESGGSARWRR
jgi:DNA-3-methyladenine glycosylase I